MRKFFTVIFVVGLLFSAVACAPKPEVRDRIGVVVTVLPQAEFVENVGREKVDVTVMVPPGANPHTYEPMPSQMEALAKAKMYAKVGAGIEFELDSPACSLSNVVSSLPHLRDETTALWHQGGDLEGLCLGASGEENAKDHGE